MGSLAQRLGQRARILLLLADGFTPKDVSQQLKISAPVVFKLRIPRHPDTQPTNIRTPVPRSFGQAVGAQRRRFALLV